MPILNASAQTMLSDKDAACFRGAARRTELSGPKTLYRLAGSKTADGRWARDQERGAWWFDSDMLNALKTDVFDAVYDGDNQQRRNILAGTRTDLAVVQKWSDMSWFCLLKLAAGDSLWVWVGIAEQQQDRGHGFFEGMMPGGGTQYFIPGLNKVTALDAKKHPTHEIIGQMARSPSWRG